MTWRYVEARDAGGAPPQRACSASGATAGCGGWRSATLRQRYVGSALGLAWTALSPLLFVAVYVSIFTFVFRGQAQSGGSDREYALYVLSGLLPWVAFSDVAGRATQTMAEHRNLVKYAVFPVQILPLTSLYAVAFSQGIGLVLVLLLSAWVGGGLPWTLWLLPLVLLLQDPVPGRRGLAAGRPGGHPARRQGGGAADADGGDVPDPHLLPGASLPRRCAWCSS